jgi:hypothetical protein
MLTKQVAVGVVMSLCVTLCLPPSVAECAQEDTERVRQQVEKIVAKAGPGKKARVTVTFQDKSKLKGQISQVSDEAFVVTADKTGQDRTIAYTDVTSVKGSRSTGAKIAIWAVVGGVIFLGLLAYGATQVY